MQRDPLRLLVVDDDIDTRDYISAAMGRWEDQNNYEVEIKFAEDGLDCLYRLHHSEFDVLLADMRMPMMSGAQMIEVLRTNQGPNRNIPVIMISAFPEMCKESMVEMKFPNVFILDKPFDLDSFYNKIKFAATVSKQDRKRFSSPDSAEA